MKYIKHILVLFIFYCNLAYATSFVSETNYGTVVTDQPYATQVGANILNQGGNAIDAAVGVGYALAVVYPCCGNIGGGGFMLIHLANGKNTVINFREQAPLASNPNLYFDNQGKAIHSSTVGYYGVGIPGTVLGLNTALQKYGTWPLKKVMQPAIDLANQGFELNSSDITLLKDGASSFAKQSNVAAIFSKNHSSYQIGDKLIQKNLANTLNIIANQGSQAFYHGIIADKIVAASKQNTGVITKQDLVNYHVEEQQPIKCNYRGYDVLTIPPPGSGVTVCEILNITEGYPLHRMGYHTARATHYILEAMRYAYADRNMYLGDTDFVAVPIAKLISKEYAAQIRQKILPNIAGDSKKIGFTSVDQEKPQTTSYAIADKFGNVVVVTYTLNGFFGAKVIASDTGFFLNNEIDDFTLNTKIPNMFGLIQGKANLIAGRKRPLSSIAPVILLKDQNFFLALGTPGGSTIPTQTVQAIEDIIDYKMNIQQAVNARRFHMQWLPDIVYYQPATFALHEFIKLKIMGYHFQLGSPYHTLYWGSMAGIINDSKTKKLTGAMQN